MMPLQDVINFTLRRARLDTPQAFCARLARFGVLALRYPVREHRASVLRGSAELVTRQVQGSYMRLNPHDPGISTDLLLDGIREPLITKAFVGMLKPGDIVVDCGANIGYYALQEARAVGPQGRVYAIEPVPGNVKALMDNIVLNSYHNIDVFRLAGGSSNRDDYINISEMSNMCSMVKKKGYRRYVDRVPVKVMTLDAFCEMKRITPDVVRMDVEGYEVEIIQGMDKLLKSGKTLKIFIEVHFDILLDRVLPMLETLREYGFEVSVATFEPHATVKNSRVYPLVQWLERIVGAKSGYLDLTMDDLLTRKEFRSGQVEDLEVIFERK